MGDGYETHVDAPNKLGIQRHWGATSGEMLIKASQKPVEQARTNEATHSLALVSESDALFQAQDLIRSIDDMQRQAPMIGVTVYALDPERHDPGNGDRDRGLDSGHSSRCFC
ncbi:hypothetical protein [Maricaulis maris]|uniref:hypothetical protein n=1 Tax=Maricaulis maris TaxID=74318 RepID=UPI003B8DE2D5